MLEVRTVLNMVLGAFQNLTTNPSLDALAAYLFTTAAVCLIPALLVSLVMQKDVVSPTFKFWGKWFVGGPLNVVRVVIHAIAQAVADLTCRRFTAEKPLGHIIAFGANFAFWVTNLFAKIVVAVTSLGQKAKSTTAAHH